MGELSSIFPFFPLVICFFSTIPPSRAPTGEVTSTCLQLGTLTQGSSASFATHRLDDCANYPQVLCLFAFVSQTSLLMHFFHNCSVINSLEHSPFCPTQGKHRRYPCRVQDVAGPGRCIYIRRGNVEKNGTQTLVIIKPKMFLP